MSGVGAGEDALVMTLIIDEFPALLSDSTLLLDDLVASVVTVLTFLVVEELEEGLEVVVVVVVVAVGLALVEVLSLEVNLCAREDVTLVVLLIVLGAAVDACLFNPIDSFTCDGSSNFTVERTTSGFRVVLLSLDFAATSILDLLEESDVVGFFVVVFESSTNTTTVFGSFNKFFTLLGALVDADVSLCTCFEDVELPEPGLEVVEPLKSRISMSRVFEPEPALLSPSRTLLTTSFMIETSSSLS